MFEKLKKYILFFLSDLKSLFFEMLPHGKVEKTVVAVSLFVYLPLAFCLGINTSFIYNTNILSDIYFNFDTSSYVKGLIESWHPIIGDPRHPFLTFITWPFSLFGKLLSLFFGIRAGFYVFLSLAGLMVACSNMYVYRYLSDIVRIGIKRSLLLTVFFCFFATNLTLSFTPESYPFSLFFLTFMMMTFSGNIRENKKISFFRIFVLGNVIAGITVTNIVKCFIPDLFSGLKITRVLKRSFAVGIFFLVVYFGLFKVVNVDVIGALSGYSNKFISADTYNEAFHTSKGNALFSYFFNAPVYWGTFTNIPMGKSDYPQLNIAYCSHFSDYILGGILLSLCACSVIMNRKNRLIFILLLSLFVDFFLTFIMNFGLFESFIYGGHWVFIIPMLLGWMYHGLKTGRQRVVFDVVMTVMFVALLINNACRMSQIFDFALKYYPV
ncbi:MAG: DUF6080 domain-containing protein [Candidatus Azobacteroides sp.]|nr:DUF6080 domain-containing protein [Candidatus Azobacteroides sp.]